MAHKTPRWLKLTHKYLALLVSVQLVIWLVTGFWLGRLESLANAPTRVETQQSSLPSMASLIEPQQILLNHETSLVNSPAKENKSIKLTLVPFLQSWAYQLTHKQQRHNYWENKHSLYYANSGQKIVIDELLAVQLAKNSYALSPLIKSVSVIEPPIDDLPREENKVWRVHMQDEWDTRIYLHTQTGKVIAHKTTQTDLKDLLLKLHFMDYAQKGSFNNIFIKFFAIVSLFMSISGLYWLLILSINKLRKNNAYSV